MHARRLVPVIILWTGVALPSPVQAALLWHWSYSAPGISAGGTLTTSDTRNGKGFYQITGISGARNGETITGLQKTGTPIPGNEPFAVDNLMSAHSPQLTDHGFGYSIADGSFANPFFASFLPHPGYLEFFSAPPLTRELPVHFTAAIVPEQR